mmetsp:Transcript_32719/g.79318  ORF Transcript_32719/g.79318 Transcript_32719/m.79318 type:complete len:85 (+) Transcript_32719:316-570(+)
MSNLFSQKEFNKDISAWDVASVTDAMESMFEGFEGFNQSQSCQVGRFISDQYRMNIVFALTKVFNQDLDSRNTYFISDIHAMHV